MGLLIFDKTSSLLILYVGLYHLIGISNILVYYNMIYIVSRIIFLRGEKKE